MERQTLYGLIAGIVTIVVVLIIVAVIIFFVVKKNKKEAEGQTDEKNDDKPSKESFSKTMLTNAAKHSKTKGIQENYSDVKVQNSDDRIKAILNRWV